MLRAVVYDDGSQRVLPDPLEYTVGVTDARGTGPGLAASTIRAAREQMAHPVYTPGTWPLFEVQVTLTNAGARLHLSIDFLIANFVSIQLLLEHSAAAGRAAPPAQRSLHRPRTARGDLSRLCAGRAPAARRQPPRARPGVLVESP